MLSDVLPELPELPEGFKWKLKVKKEKYLSDYVEQLDLKGMQAMYREIYK